MRFGARRARPYPVRVGFSGVLVQALLYQECWRFYAYISATIEQVRGRRWHDRETVSPRPLARLAYVFIYYDQQGRYCVMRARSIQREERNHRWRFDIAL